MDLSQFDDAGGRSMSSTPTPLQMSAGGKELSFVVCVTD